jgi:hypothetical protein
MARPRQPKPSPRSARGGGTHPPAGGFSDAPGTAPAPGNSSPVEPSRQASRQKVIPDAVAARMLRRIAIATGLPTLLGVGVFIASYVVVSRGILAIAPAATLAASGACFLLGVLGLSYGVLSASWEEGPGSLLGAEQIPLNLSRLRESIRAMRQGNAAKP